MNDKIYKTLENHINDYESQINSSFNGNTALFSIFDNFFQKIRQDDELTEKSGIKYENCLIPYKIVELIQKNDLEFLVQLKNIDSENDLIPFLESEVWIEKTKIKKLKNKEFDISQLIGFSVFDKNAGLIGVLNEIQENKFQQLMKIKTSQNREILIPFVEEFIIEINSKNKLIELDLPAGLLEMND
jgi:16S rRNA processing protein RimM